MEFWRRKIATSALEKCYDDNRTTGRSVNNNKSKDFLNEDLVSSVVPPVTVVLEGRSICHRISLHKHASYGSLAKALRQMFVDGDADDAGLDLSNAIPGHLIAYEDMENDLLLVGDLSWKDFVRVARRIRILPRKSNSRKGSI
ncbi:PREDICTED: auxin-responsive protein IAA33 [Ipomoea nil]|uniref:auxin-responsive protein IAA33 n=1 Tax=Ipomoea nil TaxID=35883 RepID=UPI0009017995|nr:PREDICTED: auxin-responsive protein IAA33 [Ipomoea nil]